MERKSVPVYEVIVFPPSASFRWNVHDYPHHLAKWHYHVEYELHLIQNSSGTMMIGDYVGPFEPDCLVLTGPNLPHNWLSDTGNLIIPDRDMLIQFSPECADRICTNFPEFEEVQRFLSEAAFGLLFSGDTARKGASLLRQIGRAQGAQRMILFLELLATLARIPSERKTLSHRAPAATIPSRPSEKAERAINYIHNNYFSDIHLTTIAQLCGMESSAFSRFFKKQTGHTFAKYVNQTRIYSACTLLAHTDRSVTEICFDVGFNNIANFNRQFVKFCDQTPSAYRRTARRCTTPAPASIQESIFMPARYGSNASPDKKVQIPMSRGVEAFTGA
ncbi:AraC family transcriptional regulator [Microvirga vignae]|uniref:AraC family transcriptional regulator n=1 Tax=Microvirga vignae TaxID=1225564 RepID=UPI0009FD2A5A|nr:AraC family transcriptional regulator [Microvirga vignae]